MKTDNSQKQLNSPLEQFKAVYEDNCAEINGRLYHFTNMVHKQRLEVFGYFSKIQDNIKSSDFSFFTSLEFEKAQRIIDNVVTHEENRIAALKEHWESYPEDFILFYITAMGVISYPFLKGFALD